MSRICVNPHVRFIDMKVDSETGFTDIIVNSDIHNEGNDVDILFDTLKTTVSKRIKGGFLKEIAVGVPSGQFSKYKRGRLRKGASISVPFILSGLSKNDTVLIETTFSIDVKKYRFAPLAIKRNIGMTCQSMFIV